MRETVLLSGGLDSATALAARRESHGDFTALFVDLGQPARVEEEASARKLAQHFDVTLDVVTVSGLRVGVGLIPGRNLLLLSVALTASAAEGGMLTMGIHAGTAYWDCSAGFVATAQAVLDGYGNGRVQLNAPFLALRKPDIVRLAHSLEVPLDLTYSCEQSGGPCGCCVSCQDRASIDAAAA